MNFLPSMHFEFGMFAIHRQLGGSFKLLTTLLLGLFATSLHALQSGNFIYSSYADGVIIDGYTGQGGAVAIPDTIAGLPVFAFDAAFKGNTTITSVTIPSSVTQIGTDAFNGCTGLTSITIPPSITSIDRSAFSGCTGLTSVSIASGVTSIGDGAFRSCTNLTSISIPSTVTLIASQAFALCLNLEDISVEASSTTFSARDGVLLNKDETTLLQYPGGKSGEYTIPSTVTTINYYAFAFCAGLTSVTIPPGITTIGPEAFQACTGMTSVTIPSSVTLIDINAFDGCTSLKSVTIPPSTTTINSYAFFNCTGLTSVNISFGVTKIDLYAFSFCTSLTSVSIPASVTQIGFYAFADCSSLVSISIPASNPNYTTIGGVLFNKPQTTLIQYPGGKTGAYTVPSSVTSIGGLAFRSSVGLTSVTIPSSVTSIDSSAFIGCSNLANFAVSASSTSYSTTGGVLLNKAKTILLQYPGGRYGGYTIPAGITSIGTSAFASNEGLTSVTIPSGVTFIGNNSFNACTSLTSVTISSTVTRIGADSFAYCTGLTSLTIPASVTRIGSFAFIGCRALTTAIFLGSAPTSFGAVVFGGTASDFTIRFYAGATGFTTPTWNDYPTVALPTDLANPDLVRNLNGSITLTWPAPKGVTNPSFLIDVVFRSSNMAGWTVIESPNLSIQAGIVVFTDPSPLPGKGFYRIGRPVSP